MTVYVTTFRKPKTRNMFLSGVAEILKISPLQLRDHPRYALCGCDVWVSGTYRHNGQYYRYTVNIDSGEVLLNVPHKGINKIIEVSHE